MVMVGGIASHPDGVVGLRSDADILSGSDERVGGEERSRTQHSVGVIDPDPRLHGALHRIDHREDRFDPPDEFSAGVRLGLDFDRLPDGEVRESALRDPYLAEEDPSIDHCCDVCPRAHLFAGAKIEEGDVAVDRVNDTVWAADDFHITEYTPQGVPLNGFNPPGLMAPVMGLGFDAQARTLPPWSVIVMIVLLNELLM